MVKARSMFSAIPSVLISWRPIRSTRGAYLNLSEGLHTVRLEYFERTGSQDEAEKSHAASGLRRCPLKIGVPGS